MKSWKTPIPEQVDKAIAQIAHLEHRKYFFDKLNNPEWLEPLSQKGIFAEPPQPIRDEAKGTILFPPWPEGEYLSKVADAKPELVCQIILRIQTDNFWAHENFIDAALTMPGKLAAQIGEKELAWIKQLKYFYRLLPDKLGLLTAHLARHGECDIALKLATALLEPQTRESKTDKENAYRLREALARFETWDYEQIIEKNVPEVIKFCGLKGLELLCQLLTQAIRLEQTEDRNGSEDGSYIWRESIKENSSRENIKNILVSAIRDAFLTKSKEGSDTHTLIELLEKQPYKVFRRLELYFLQHYPISSLIEKRLSDKSCFSDITLRNEYSELLAKYFATLSPNAQKTILGWIDNGPKPRVSRIGRDLTPEENRAYVGRWQRDWLAYVVDAAPAEYKTRFDSFVKEMGPPHKFVAFKVETAWVGPKSPKSEQELREMPISALVNYLKTWTPPSNSHYEASPEGLGRQLSEILAKNPAPYALAANEFIGIDPTYIRSLIHGLGKALNGNLVFDWINVLNLCDWVLKQPVAITGRIQSEDTDPNWEWTRKEIGRLLESGVTSGQNPIPIKLREKIWAIIEPLTSDADPTPQTDAEYARLESDPATLSINSTRGQALHATIQYGLWVHRHLEKETPSEVSTKKGFLLMPEVQQVLELHLDITHETSTAARSVYGRWFPWLVLLDKKWTIDHIKAIFPSDDSQRDLWDAAWSTYVTFCRAYDEPFALLRQEYRKALNQMGAIPKSKYAQKDADERIAEHLMELYGRGQLSLDPLDEILELFWGKAPPNIKARAIGSMGSALHNSEGDMPKDVLTRLQALWEYRMTKLKDVAADSESAKELEEFGWWVASGKFEPTWALDQLETILNITDGRIEIGHLVVERLANNVANHPAVVLRCTEMMIKGERKGWGVLSWRDNLKIILQTAITSTNADIRRSAENIIHLLGRLGHANFREILPTNCGDVPDIPPAREL